MSLKDLQESESTFLFVEQFVKIKNSVNKKYGFNFITYLSIFTNSIG